MTMTAAVRALRSRPGSSAAVVLILRRGHRREVAALTGIFAGLALLSSLTGLYTVLPASIR